MKNKKIICKKCQESFPKKRKDLGYSVCVKCSTEQGWSCSALTHHKTGNTIEIIKDPELAYNINQIASRKSYGVMSGVTGRYKRYRSDKDIPERKTKIVNKAGEIINGKSKKLGILNGQTMDFEIQIQQAFSILDSNGINDCIEWIKAQYKSLLLSQSDFVRIIKIIKTVYNA